KCLDPAEGRDFPSSSNEYPRRLRCETASPRIASQAVPELHRMRVDRSANGAKELARISQKNQKTETAAIGIVACDPLQKRVGTTNRARRRPAHIATTDRILTVTREYLLGIGNIRRPQPQSFRHDFLFRHRFHSQFSC